MTTHPELAGARWATGTTNQIYDHVFSDLDNETGGFLLGRFVDDQRVLITTPVRAARAEGRADSVTFTQDDWAHVHEVLESRPGEQIIGWYHSHPGFGIFLSEFDLFIHHNFFADAGQIAYVVDPRAGTEGIFGWREGEVQLLGERRTTRAPAPVPAQPARLAVTVGPPSADPPAAAHAVTDYLPAVLAGVLLGLLAALLVFG